ADLAAGPDGDDEVVAQGLPAHDEALVDLADQLLDGVVVEVLGDAEGGVGGRAGVVQVDATDLVAAGLDDERFGLRRPGLSLEVVSGHSGVLSVATSDWVGSSHALRSSLSVPLHDPFVRGDLAQPGGAA